MNTAQTLIVINLLYGLTMLIGLFNNIAITSFFGLNRQVDAFFAAFVIPSFFMNLTVDFMGRNFLPAFSELKHKSADEASLFASTLINFAFLFGIVFVLIVALVSKPLFALMLPGFASAEIGSVRKMFLIMAPAVALMPVTTFSSYILQHERSYLRITLSQMLLPLSLLGFIVMGHDYLGELALPVGFLIGRVTVSAFLASSTSFRYRLRLNLRGNYIRRIFINSGVLMAGGLLGKLQPLIEKYYASLLGAGAISAIEISSKVSQPVQQLSSSGISMVSFSKTSRMVAEGKMKETGELISRSVIAVSLVIVPVIVWMAFVSDELLRVLFLRGKFDATMHQTVVQAFWGQLPSILFLSCGTILANAFYALNRTAVPAILNVTGVLLYLLFVRVLSVKYGILGVSLSWSVVACFSFLALVTLLSKERIAFSASPILAKILCYSVSSAACFWFALKITRFFSSRGILFCLITFAVGIAGYLTVLVFSKESGVLYLKEKLFSKRTKDITANGTLIG